MSLHFPVHPTKRIQEETISFDLLFFFLASLGTVIAPVMIQASRENRRILSWR